MEPASEDGFRTVYLATREDTSKLLSYLGSLNLLLASIWEPLYFEEVSNSGFLIEFYEPSSESELSNKSSLLLANLDFLTTSPFGYGIFYLPTPTD